MPLGIQNKHSVANLDMLTYDDDDDDDDNADDDDNDDTGVERVSYPPPLFRLT